MRPKCATTWSPGDRDLRSQLVILRKIAMPGMGTHYASNNNMSPLRSRMMLAAGSALAIGLVLASPPMVSTADGCSGMPSYPYDNPIGSWESLAFPDGTTLPPDGVVVLHGMRHSLGTSDTKPLGVSVSVTDSFAEPVAGKLWLEPGGRHWPASWYAIWRPSAQLQAEATYTLTWHGEQSGELDGTATFVTSSAVSVLADLEITSPTLQRTHALTGERVHCSNLDVCPEPPSFATTEIEPYGMSFAVSEPKEPNTFQALSLREVPGKGTFVETYDTPSQRNRAVMAAPWHGYRDFSVWFAEVLPEYCVELVQRDLRNDVERTKQLCVPRTELALTGGSRLDAHLKLCSSPPDPSYLERWCALKPLAQECQALDAGTNNAPDDSGGCSCRMPAPAPAGLPSGALLILLALGAWRRRS